MNPVAPGTDRRCSLCPHRGEKTRKGLTVLVMMWKLASKHTNPIGLKGEDQGIRVNVVEVTRVCRPS